jgi:phosphatidylglycerol:prolipoprotein diacylglycerol transferase
MLRAAVITINIDPEIHLGPLTLAWHGLTIALGILIGAFAAARWLRERGMDVEPMYKFAGLAALGGIVGARIFYVFEHDPGCCWCPAVCSRATASRSTAASSSPPCSSPPTCTARG